MNRDKLYTKGLTTLDIDMCIKSFYGDKVQTLFSNDNYDKLIFRIYLTDKTITDIITDLKALEYNIMEKIIITGIDKIKKVSISHKGIKQLNKTDYFKKIETNEEYILETDGTNLASILGNKYVNSKKTISNDISEIYEIMGIEAARQAIYNEIDDILNSTTSVNHRHIALLVDTMTCKGHLLSIDRHGINRSDIGPLAKCSFEETSDILIKAGIFGELDKINGVSANIMLGQIAKCGTGDSEIIFDESQLVNMRPTQEQFDEILDDDVNIDDCDIDFEFSYVENNEDIEQKTHSKLILT